MLTNYINLYPVKLNLNPNPSKKIDRDAEEHYLDKDYGSPQSTNGKEMAGGGNGRQAAAYF